MGEKVYAELKEHLNVKTRVDTVDDCNRDKCPNLMELCPTGGRCLVNSNCKKDGCICDISVACANNTDFRLQDIAKYQKETGKSSQMVCLDKSPSLAYCRAFIDQKCDLKLQTTCPRSGRCDATINENTCCFLKTCNPVTDDQEVVLNSEFGEDYDDSNMPRKNLNLGRKFKRKRNHPSHKQSNLRQVGPGRGVRRYGRPIIGGKRRWHSRNPQSRGKPAWRNQGQSKNNRKKIIANMNEGADYMDVFPLNVHKIPNKNSRKYANNMNIYGSRKNSKESLKKGPTDKKNTFIHGQIVYSEENEETAPKLTKKYKSSMQEENSDETSSFSLEVITEGTIIDESSKTELNANENKSTSTIESETVESYDESFEPKIDDEELTEDSTYTIESETIYESYDENAESITRYVINTEGTASNVESKIVDENAESITDDEINTEGSTFINKDVVYESYDEKSESTRGEYEIVTEGSSSSAESESEDDSHHENAKYRTNYERDNEGSTEPKIVNESYDENAREIKDQGVKNGYD